MNKKIIIPLVLLLVIGSFALYRYYNKPHRNVDDESAIEIAADQLFHDYETNETEANAKYLDKAVQVAGVVREVSSNQEGKTIVILETGNAFGGIACTMEEKSGDLRAGVKITVKGICKGYLTDVIITQAKHV